MERSGKKGLIIATVVCGILLLSVAVLTGAYHRLQGGREKIPPRLPETETMTEPTITAQIETTETAIATEHGEPTEESYMEPETTESAESRPFLIVIDPGHQLYGDYGVEPLGPGADQQKARVSSGTQGTVTKLPEHELNLTVSFLLRQVLTDRGYEVILLRETADVSMSNAERAQMANRLRADAFLRIHANSDSDSSVHGALTICMTPDNPYNSDIYEESRALSDLILTELCSATGAKNRSVWETDTMTGINWCTVPVTIVEMGFMSNPDEDTLLSDPDYQGKIAEGIAKGLDRYFATLSQETEGDSLPSDQS